MDFMPSHPVESLAEADQATRDRALTRLFALFLRELFDWGVVQTDPNFANYRIAPDSGRLVLLDFGAARSFAPEVVAGFRSMMQALAEGDETALRAAFLENGFIRPATPETQVKTLLEMAGVLHRILTSGTAVDFGDPGLLTRMRALGERLGMEEGYREIPPIDALFLQRKMAGLVLLATRMQARVPVAELLAPYLSASPDAVPRASVA